MSKIWFTSDLHLNQQRTLDLSKRPFVNLTEMNQTIIDNWNNVVHNTDIVYILGDAGDYDYLKYLKGHKKLITGNYERRDKNILDKIVTPDFEILTDNEIKIVNYNNKIYTLNMSHEPSKLKNIPIDETHINLFGHIHKLCMIKEFGLNVGTDCHNFTSIDMNTILFYHQGILNYYDNEVFN